MSLKNLITDIGRLISTNGYCCDECAENLKSEIIEFVEGRLLRPEILAFADAMEAEMASHDAEKGDSWKEMDKDKLSSLMFDSLWGWNVQWSENKIKPSHLIDIANFCMMLHWRAKNDGIETD